MKYVILVSHGNLAKGLLDSLEMLAGKREDVIAIGLKNGVTADQFALDFAAIINEMPNDAQIILLADIIGGSPLTTAMNTLASLDRLDKTLAIGGMNLPLALTTVLMKDAFEGQELITNVLGEAIEALKPFVLKINDEEDDI